MALDRDVAIKVHRIDPKSGLSEEARVESVLRFQPEAQAAARLNHPNIVSIYHVGKMRDQHDIVMEYLRGKSIAQVLKPGREFPLPQLLKQMIQICIAQMLNILMADLSIGKKKLCKPNRNGQGYLLHLSHLEFSMDRRVPWRICDGRGGRSHDLVSPPH